MPPGAHLSKTRSLSLPLAGLVIASVMAAGCDERLDRVRSYAVPKEAPPARATATPSNTAQVPVGEIAWDLPAGWHLSENTVQMRYATLHAGHGPDQIEISVTQLTGMAGGVAANINRWRGQVGLPPADDQELARTVIPIEADGARGVLVDLVGPGPAEQAPRMLAAIFAERTNTWFFKTMASSAVMEKHRAGFDELCRSVRFGQAGAVATTPPPSGGEAMPRWSVVPEGWSVDAEPAAMSVASLTVTGDGQDASLTITPLGGAQDLLANVNRWRRQLGLGPVDDIASASPVAMEINGNRAVLVDIAGEDRRTLGVVMNQAGTTWFFKLSGPDPLVAGQRAAFEEFVRSIRFEST